MALLAAWVSMLFGTSAPIAYFGFSRAAGTDVSRFSDLPAATWEVGDAVGPLAKLLVIGFFATLVLFGERWRVTSLQHRYALNAGLGLAAMLLTLGLIPESYSRGFGIGLTGARYDLRVLPIYFLGGVLGGTAYTFSITRCRRRLAIPR